MKRNHNDCVCLVVTFCLRSRNAAYNDHSKPDIIVRLIYHVKENNDIRRKI